MQAAPARPPVASASGRRLSLVLGILLAVIAFLGVAGLGIYASSNAGGGASVTVVVAAQDIPARTPITADMLKTQSIPQQGVQPNAVLKMDQATGKAAAVAIPQGSQLTSNVLVSGGSIPQVKAYLPIPKGWVARAVPAGELVGVAGYIQPGDYINVIASVSLSVFNTPGHPTNKTANVSKTTLTQVRVIEVGPATSNSSSSSAPASGVTSTFTVILTQCDSEYFDWLLNNTKTTYTVLSYKDYGPAPSQPVTSCPPTTSTGVGPDQVDSRFHFTQV